MPPMQPFATLDVFTRQRFGGNPLAVLPQGGTLNDATMQQVAREFNLSETTFVSPPQNPQHTARVRIFTPQTELPFAGHPTLGTAAYLARQGQVTLTPDATGQKQGTAVLELNIGPVPVEVREESDGTLYAELCLTHAPEVGPPVPTLADLARCVGLSPDDLLDESGEDGWQPQGVSMGVTFLCLPAVSQEAVRRATPDTAAIRDVLGPWWSQHLWVFARAENAEGEAPADFHARMFAPTLGVTEDPATGSAAAAFGAYLGLRMPTRPQEPTTRDRWTVRQGVEMQRPSRLEIAVTKTGNTVSEIRVGGHVVPMSSGELPVG